MSQFMHKIYDEAESYRKSCAEANAKVSQLEAENKKLREAMRLHAGDCCSLSNEADMFRGYWEDEEAENKRLREALEKIRDEEKTDREMFADLLRRDGEAYKEAMEHISKSETIAEEALK